MNHASLIFLGALLTFSASWFGIIVYPILQIKDQVQVTIPPEDRPYPTIRPGLAQQGAEVYRKNGCYYCHTQQVRPQGFGADFERGWGLRFSVAQDYLYDSPVMLGNFRSGPDLRNIGIRQPDENWHYVHLYNPQITSKGSTMPPYVYLFEKVKSGVTPSPAAIKLPTEWSKDVGYEIIPTAEAKALVAYLVSLRSQVPLFEAPLAPTNQSTNASAATSQTNAPISTPAP